MTDLPVSPEEVLKVVFDEWLAAADPGDGEAGRWWYAALGATFALGSVGLLSKDQVIVAEQRLGDEAARLGLAVEP